METTPTPVEAEFLSPRGAKLRIWNPQRRDTHMANIPLQDVCYNLDPLCLSVGTKFRSTPFWY